MDRLRRLTKRIVPRGSRIFELLETTYHLRFALAEKRALKLFHDRMARATDPFVVQIGANEGDDEFYDDIVDYDPRGVLVEPQKEVFESLRLAYAQHPKIQLENVAIAATPGTRKLFKARRSHIGNFPTSGLASFVPDRNGLADEGDDQLCVEEVNCMRFRELIDKYAVDQITYLQIDTEGYDFEILKGIDFDHAKPDMLRYEYINLTDAEQAESLSMLEDAGYATIKLAIDVFAYQR